MNSLEAHFTLTNLERDRMTNQLPKAILFDMDDTILAYFHNTDHSWQVVCNGFADRVGSRHTSALSDVCYLA